MSVLELKQHIQALSVQEIAEMRLFLDHLESTAFDQQLETDSANGVFDALVERLESQIERGDWKPL